MMDAKVQKACAWCGVGIFILFFVGFWGIAGFIPPVSPEKDPTALAEMFQDDKYRIRAGLIIACFGAALFGPWVALITIQMRRIEGGQHTPLAYAQLALGALLPLEFIFPIMCWLVATYRSERSPEMIQMLNDLAWIPFDGLGYTSLVQMVIIGIVILRDQRTVPIFPRWAGYFSIWSAFAFTFGTFNVFFKDGPLAWNGLIAWYILIITFGVWALVMTWLLLRAVNQQAQEEASEPLVTQNGSALTIEMLAAELGEVRKELARRPVIDNPSR